MSHHVPMAEAVATTGHSRSHIYRQAGLGRLTLAKRGRTTLVDLDELRAIDQELKPVTKRAGWADLRLERDAYRDATVLLVGFAERVANYCTDDVLSREATALASKAQALVMR